jgi:hypothetical protein
MTLGNILRERDDQYVANRDQSGTWRILDTWHDDLKNIGPYIPDERSRAFWSPRQCL